MSSAHNAYRDVVTEFARTGAEIIRLNPSVHYERLGNAAWRPLVPGFVPVENRPLLTAISYYPNESDLTSEQYAAAREAFDRWGHTGSYEDYFTAYELWSRIREQIPFYRRWEAPLYDRLGLQPSETAWLPLIKCPLPARANIDRNGIDISRDMNMLWDQLNLLKPELILIQGAVVNDVLGQRLDNLRFVRAHPLQKIPQQISNAAMQEQFDRLTAQLQPHIRALRNDRTQEGTLS